MHLGFDTRRRTLATLAAASALLTLLLTGPTLAFAAFLG
jgi:hypothetical protein